MGDQDRCPLEFFISHSFEYHYTKYSYSDQYAGYPFLFSIGPQPKRLIITRRKNLPTRLPIAAMLNLTMPTKGKKKKVDSSYLKRNPLFYQAFVKYTYIVASQSSGPYNINDTYNNTSAGVEFVKNGKIGLSASGEYYF